MTARGILAHASVLCAVSALAACSTSNQASRYPVAAPVQEVAFRQPEIAPASTALNRVTAALDVNIRQIKVTPAPTSLTLAAADIQPRTILISRGLQCVPFARERSGVAIRGNANTWWNQASGGFVRVKAPTIGSVMVMQTRRGHVGVVTKIIDDRQIVIDHANWLSNGQIYLDQPVLDVSANNDWSKVVVWHPNLGMYGKRALGVSGFIVDAPAHGNQTVYASLADVPSALTANIQYADNLTAPAAAPKAVAMPAAAPVLVAAAVPPAYEAVIVPPAKPDAVVLRGVPAQETAPAIAAPVAVAEAKPVYVDTIVPGAKPAGVSAPMAVAAAEPAPAAAVVADATPTYVDTIVPTAKPAGVSAPMAMAAAEEAAPAVVADAGVTYVDAIVPAAKPANLGATAVAVVGKGETTNAAEVAFVPSGKPASVATFR